MFAMEDGTSGVVGMPCCCPFGSVCFNFLSFTDMKTKVHDNEESGSSKVEEGVSSKAENSDKSL